jgi:hypothetical protein
LDDPVVKLECAESFNHESVRQLLKNTLKPWQKQEGCIPEVSGDFVTAMEDVLDVVAEPYDPKRPVVCFDESPWHLMAEVRKTIPAEPGKSAREDTEYTRQSLTQLSETDFRPLVNAVYDPSSMTRAGKLS